MARLDFSQYRRVLATAGAPWFTIAGWVGRFPRSTLNLGVILLVQAVTGSYALAGVVAAVFVVGMAVAGPGWSRLMDRRGQCPTLLIAAVTLVAAVGAFIAAVLLEAPLPAWFALALVAGTMSADVGPAVRARWSALVPGEGRHSAFALESIADESVFVIAPPVLTLIAGLAAGPLGSAGRGAALGIAVVAVVGAAGVAWLALLHRSQPPLTPASSARVRLLPPAGILPVTIAWIGVGGMFGAFDVTAVAWGQHLGPAWLAGAMMAALAVGNTAGALVYGALRLKASLRSRWLWGATLLALCSFALPLAGGGWAALAVAVLVGAVIGPVLVAGYALVESRADRDRVTELLAYPSLGVGAGIPMGSTLAGIGLDAAGAGAGFFVMACFAVSIVVIGGIGEALLRVARAGRAVAVGAD